MSENNTDENVLDDIDYEKLDRALWRALRKSTTLIAEGRLVDSDEGNTNAEEKKANEL